MVNYYERGVSTSSLTKLFGVTGLRFGWFATTDKDLFTEMFGIIYDSVLCNSILTEVIGGKFLEPENYSRLLNEGKERGKKNLEVLTKMVDGSGTMKQRYKMGNNSVRVILEPRNRSTAPSTNRKNVTPQRAPDWVQ